MNHQRPIETPTLAAETILADYRTVYLSRQMSLAARREVHSGRAKFGTFGDGKEVAQAALARVFRPGDWRAGYYRDQTLMLALGLLTPQAYFAQLYAHTDLAHEPATGGRAMLSHFNTPLLDDRGNWRAQVDHFNSSADISPTAGQMPRLVGLAYASRLYRMLPALQAFSTFSDHGNEVAFGTIGNASCAEGLFWEAINAIGVLQAPAVISIWDDGYGISVPNDEQIMGGNLSVLLEGFRGGDADTHGYGLYTVPGWDYPALCEAYAEAAARARAAHRPAIVHVVEMTQPLGHSTSGSHTRYKPAERLRFEAEYDPLVRMRNWVVDMGIAGDEDLQRLEAAVRFEVEACCERAWEACTAAPRAEAAELGQLLAQAAGHSPDPLTLLAIKDSLGESLVPLRRELVEKAHQALLHLRTEENPIREELAAWAARLVTTQRRDYAAHLYSEGRQSPLHVPAVPPVYPAELRQVRGFDVLQANFDAMLAGDPRVFIFGEDVGRLGDVNSGVAGLQAKYGALRVGDTGIREASIVGQAIGMALRGLRPIAEIQYLDYLLYALPTLSDDLATLRWRTAGGHKAPVIIRTRGHRLEGIWHAGSPMALLLDALRGMHVLVPRNMTQAAGFYNTLLRGDDPALVVEVLNGYRLPEPLPANHGRYTVPLGVPEVLKEGGDVTVVTYGACCRVALNAAALLQEVGIDVEVIDVQSLLPFDRSGTIVASLQKTNRIVVLDEDAPGGASAYILQQLLEAQDGFRWLDSAPSTITAPPHRPAYGSDGNYFCKPNAEDLFRRVYRIMHEAAPRRFPILFAEDE